MMRKGALMICAGAAALSYVTFAHATTLNILQVSGSPPSGELSVNLASAPDSKSSTGTATGDVLNFASSDFLDFANGNGTISVHGGGTFTNLTISSAITFTDLEFGALFPNGSGGTVDVTGSGVLAPVSTNVGPGLQKILVTSTSPLTSLMITTGSAFSQLKNFAISGLDPVSVPLPSTFTLFGGGLAAFFGLTMWSKRKRRSAVSL